jgi:hypothetical protein
LDIGAAVSAIMLDMRGIGVSIDRERLRVYAEAIEVD